MIGSHISSLPPDFGLAQCGLEVVAQRELHHTRLTVGLRIVAEGTPGQGDPERSIRVSIKPDGVGDVKYLPGELYTLGLRDLEHLG